ncbi:tetratricopeptide repeat protein [Oleiharenicola lentus]|uniref:tetratricopeptide repeat protein n=1 Tax=Oleiharenicola lentus TaxID=2508720 RepID=UPI003F66F315
MTSAARHKPIIPWWQLGLLLVGCALGIWFLLPDDPGLLEDLVRDGNTREARRLLAKMSPDERARDARRLRVVELKIARLELKANDAEATTRFWKLAVDTWRDSQFSGEVFLEFAPVILRLSDPAAAWEMLLPILPGAPEPLRQRLASEFTRAALAASQPAQAAQIFAYAHPAESRTVENSLELARLWELGGKPADALAALGSDQSPAVNARRVAILRELNRNREAFALLRARAEALPDGSPDAALLEELTTVALAAGIPNDAVPLLQRYAAKNPSDLAVQRRLRDLLVTSGRAADAVPAGREAVKLGSRQPADLRDLAKILEYSGEGDQAFDLWLELALQGDLPAVDRLVALNPGLYRDEDLRRALERVVPVPNHNDYTLKLAELEVTVGRYDEGQKYYEQFIAADPTDIDAMLDLADLHHELYRFDQSEKWLRRASALRPKDLALRGRIADSLVLQSRHRDALDYYSVLAQESPVEEVLQPYIVLAETLGRYDHFIRAYRLRIDHSPQPVARDYLMLAYGYELADDPVSREAALAEGRRKLGDNDDLKLSLALALSAEKNYRAAQNSLSGHAALHSNATAATLYLELMRLNNDKAAERAYLAQPLAPALAQNEAILERVGRAQEALGNYKEAERIWRELYVIRPTDFNRTASLARVLLTTGRHVEANQLLAPFLIKPTPEVLRLSAEIATNAGDYKNAETYQLAYLDTVKTAGATDWGALGDIRLSRGDREGAKRAYAEALRRMHGQIRAKSPKS